MLDVTARPNASACTTPLEIWSIAVSIRVINAPIGAVEWTLFAFVLGHFTSLAGFWYRRGLELRRLFEYQSNIVGALVRTVPLELGV